jgi:hypothetical protein
MQNNSLTTAWLSQFLVSSYLDSDFDKDVAAKPAAKMMCTHGKSERQMYDVSALKFHFISTGPEHKPKQQYACAYFVQR